MAKDTELRFRDTRWFKAIRDLAAILLIAASVGTATQIIASTLANANQKCVKWTHD